MKYQAFMRNVVEQIISPTQMLYGENEPEVYEDDYSIEIRPSYREGVKRVTIAFSFKARDEYAPTPSSGDGGPVGEGWTDAVD